MASIRSKTGKDGKTRLYVQVRLKGFPPQTACFHRLTDAKKWIQETESDIRNNRYFKTSESRKHTFKELAERYMATILKDKKSGKSQTAQISWWIKELGERVLSDITPALIVECKEKLLNIVTYRKIKMTTATVNRYLAALSHIFTVATKEWGWTVDNPVKLISRAKESRGRVRFLNENERESLFTACRESKNPYLHTIVILAISTGMRLGEIISLTWNQIDFSKRRIILEETKNGERRQVPLVGKASELLIQLESNRTKCSTLIFPDKRNYRMPIDFRSAWDYALKRSGINDFRFHDLRHCCASYLAMNGASMVEIAAVLGHKTLQMTKRYTHLSDNHLSDVVAKMNEKILG